MLFLFSRLKTPSPGRGESLRLARPAAALTEHGTSRFARKRKSAESLRVSLNDVFLIFLSGNNHLE
jgi:hypothetical protein